MFLRVLLVALSLGLTLGLASPHAVAQSPSASALALAGLPDTNRPWTGQDYAKAAELLGKRGVALPSTADRRGAIIIQRLSSLDNLVALRNREVPVATRLGECSKIMISTSSILSLYVTAMSGKSAEKYSDEVIRLVAFVLHASAASIDLTDELQATLPQDDKNPARADALKKVRAGVTTSYMGAAGSLAARDYYSEAELSSLLEAMAITFPRLKKAFDPDSIKALIPQLEAHKATLKDVRDVQKTESMIAELKRMDQGGR